MRYSLALGLMLLFSLLVGCSTPSGSALDIKETWMRNVALNPAYWASDATSWFVRGDLQSIEAINRVTPYASSMSRMSVNVPYFNGIEVNGNFKVELYGSKTNTGVYVVGSNAAIRNVIIEVRNNTLYLSQIAPGIETRGMVIRVGVCDLNRLIHFGYGRIEGIRLFSSHLTIVSHSMGSIYLSGNLCLTQIIKSGCGNVTVVGGHSLLFDIRSTSLSGAINVAGKIGLRSIYQLGGGEINIIGGFSHGMNIYAEGNGKIGIVAADRSAGLNINEIVAKKQAAIYLSSVSSGKILAHVYDCAVIGMSGYVGQLYLTTYQQGRFLGRSLCAMDAFVRTHDVSHVNIATHGKLFADSLQNSSIYYFGPPGLLNAFAGGNGLIVPIFSDVSPRCELPVAIPYPVTKVTTKTYQLTPPLPKAKLRRFKVWRNLQGQG